MTTLALPFDARKAEDALALWAAGVTGLRVLWNAQAVAQPRPPYVRLHVLSTETLAPFEERIDGDVTPPRITYCALARMVVSVTAYGLSNDPNSDARAVVGKLLASLHLHAATASPAEVRAALQGLVDAGVSFHRAGPAQSLDAFSDDASVSIAQSDVVFSVAQNIETQVEDIGTVEITNEDLGMNPLVVDLDEEDA